MALHGIAEAAKMAGDSPEGYLSLSQVWQAISGCDR